MFYNEIHRLQQVTLDFSTSISFYVCSTNYEKYLQKNICCIQKKNFSFIAQCSFSITTLYTYKQACDNVITFYNMQMQYKMKLIK